MNRFMVCLAVLGVLAASGCSSVTPQPPATLVPTTSAPPTVAATETSAPIPTLTTTVAATPTVPASPTAAPTAAGVPTVAATVTPSNAVVTFTSPALGISFNYAPSQNGQTIGIQESGDKVYVYMTLLPPTSGQWVQVFQKSPATSLEAAIKAQVLQGYSLQDCLVVAAQNPNAGFPAPASYTFAQIRLPQSPDDTNDTLQAKARKCPQPYAALGGLAYFVADANHPDRFAFFSIGQYYILAGGEQPWQATFQFAGSGSAAAGGGTPGTYLDDRSTAQALLESYVNALNRREYARAYSYWEPGASQLQPFDQFQQGYADTASVELVVGPVEGDAGAGQLYSIVPVVMLAQTTTGASQAFAGCYILHLGQPAVQGVPPFRPLAIRSAQVKQVSTEADTQAYLAQACQGQPGSPAPPQPTYAPGDISASRYLDDRSDPVQVIRSYYNAVNRFEYLRAYSYWEPAAAAAKLPPFPQFQQGYADTKSVALTTGTVGTGFAAGQIYYTVPVALVAQTASSGTQTFVGCYTLHLARPEIQTAPPFQPLSIINAVLRQVANDANLTPLMGSGC